MGPKINKKYLDKSCPYVDQINILLIEYPSS